MGSTDTWYLLAIGDDCIQFWCHQCAFRYFHRFPANSSNLEAQYEDIKKSQNYGCFFPRFGVCLMLAYPILQMLTLIDIVLLL